jgi:hypothetical protein
MSDEEWNQRLQKSEERRRQKDAQIQKEVEQERATAKEAAVKIITPYLAMVNGQRSIRRSLQRNSRLTMRSQLETKLPLKSGKPPMLKLVGSWLVSLWRSISRWIKFSDTTCKFLAFESFMRLKCL